MIGMDMGGGKRRKVGGSKRKAAPYEAHAWTFCSACPDASTAALVSHCSASFPEFATKKRKTKTSWCDRFIKRFKKAQGQMSAQQEHQEFALGNNEVIPSESGDESKQQSDEEEEEAAFGTNELSGPDSDVEMPQEHKQPEVPDTELGTPETHTTETQTSAENPEFQIQCLELLTLKAKVLEAQFMAKKLAAQIKLKGLGVPEYEIEHGLPSL